MQKIIFFGLLVIFFISVHAQPIDSMLLIYKDNYQQEKTHFHFDKSIYRKGETIWFKAYLLAGRELSDCSKNFYVDWYNNRGQLLKHCLLPLFESSARGQFTIPANYEGEWLHVKAYTQWMLNFDTAFLFNKDVRVAQASNKNVQAVKVPATSIVFFPEGGDLIAGINSNIAFLATNQWGKPVAIKAALVNSKNQLIDSFQSVHDGMGKFVLEPDAKETYNCNWTDEYGINHTTQLPSIRKDGIVLEAQLTDRKLIYNVSRTQQAANNFKALHVIATINQQEVYNVKINLSVKKQIAGTIPTENLPTGVLQITTFDAGWIPVAERVVFINNHQDEFFPDVNIITKGVQKRSKNVIEIHVADTILSNLSVAVTDAGIINDSASNIFAQLLLCGDIKGYIHNPAFYFSSEADSVKQFLDLVMLTHGWRKYNWADIIARKTPVINYPKDSDYLQIKGNIYADTYTDFGKVITLIVQSKDSSKQYLVVPVKEDGSFRQRGAIFFDTVKVFYKLNGNIKRNDAAIAVKMQNGLLPLPYQKFIIGSTPAFMWNADSRDSLLLERSKYLYAENEKLQKVYEGARLKDVTVYATSKSAQEILDDKYTSGLFSSNNGYSFDVMNDQRAQGALDIFHYLQNEVPGLTMSLPVLGTNGAEDANSSNAPGLNWRDGTPDIFLNEMPSDALTLQGIQMSEVAYIKVFRPPFMGASGSGASGAIVVYTRKASDIQKQQNINSNNILLQGYTSYKEFYSPNYSVLNNNTAPDTRSTIYWNPYVLTDKKNKTVKLEFYNNDTSKKLRVIVEGVDAFGRLAKVEKIIE